MSFSCVVSTVFLGIDVAFSRGNQPILFETLVVGGVNDGLERHYATWDEAVLGHDSLVELVLKSKPFLSRRKHG